MKLMVKGGVKRWIPDVFVGYFRELGYTTEGEETPSPIPQPEAVVAVDEEDQEQPEEPAAEEPAAANQEEEPQPEPAEEQTDQPETATLEEPAAEEPESAFICPHCGKSYKTESALKGHITRSHSGEQ